jgi:hypothetical protein
MVVLRQKKLARKQCVYVKVIQHVADHLELDIVVRLQRIEQQLDIGLVEIGNMYYVYLLVNPITNQPFYCGKGKGDRWTSHLGYWSGNGKNNRCENKIKSLRSQGIEPIVRFLVEDIEDESEAYRIEENYIRENFEQLVNLKIEAKPPSNKGNIAWNKGKKMPRNFSENQSKRLKEEYLSGKRIHWSKSLSDHDKTEFYRKMAKSKLDCTSKNKTKIYCVELQKEFESQTAAAKQLNIRQGDISNVLRGNQKTVKGYTFIYM